MSEDELKVYGTPEEQLETVNAAIYAVLQGGQRYKIGTRELERADLRQLLKMQQQLKATVQASEPTSLLPDTFVAVFQGR
jgi:hypothetical protein|nr:MAG TPA: hypothetical protein [Caudoviricetes sp.]